MRQFLTFAGFIQMTAYFAVGLSYAQDANREHRLCVEAVHLLRSREVVEYFTQIRPRFAPVVAAFYAVDLGFYRVSTGETGGASNAVTAEIARLRALLRYRPALLRSASVNADARNRLSTGLDTLLNRINTPADRASRTRLEAIVDATQPRIRAFDTYMNRSVLSMMGDLSPVQLGDQAFRYRQGFRHLLSGTSSRDPALQVFIEVARRYDGHDEYRPFLAEMLESAIGMRPLDFAVPEDAAADFEEAIARIRRPGDHPDVLSSRDLEQMVLGESIYDAIPRATTRELPLDMDLRGSLSESMILATRRFTTGAICRALRRIRSIQDFEAAVPDLETWLPTSVRHR